MLKVVNYFRKNFNLYKGLYNVFRYIKNWCEKVIYFLNIVYKGLYNVFRYIKNWCEKVIYFLNIVYKGLYNVFRYIKNWCEKVIYFLNIGTVEDRKSQNSKF